MPEYVAISLQRRAVGRLFVGLGAVAALVVVAIGSDGAREGSIALLAAIVGAVFTAWIGFALERGGLEKRALAARPAPPDAEVLPDAGLRPQRAILVGIAMLAYVTLAVALLGPGGGGHDPRRGGRDRRGLDAGRALGRAVRAGPRRTAGRRAPRGRSGAHARPLRGAARSGLIGQGALAPRGGRPSPRDEAKPLIPSAPL